METLLDCICSDVIKEVTPSKIVAYGEKKNGEKLREVSLLVVAMVWLLAKPKQLKP